MASEQPNYLKAAFLNVYNLSLFGGALAATALTGQYVLGAAVVCAETDEEARWLAGSMELAWVRLRRGQFGPLPSPEEAAAYPYTPLDRATVESYRELHVAGSPEMVAAALEKVVKESGADEVIVTSMIHSHEARLRSYELLAGAVGLAGGTPKDEARDEAAA